MPRTCEIPHTPQAGEPAPDVSLTQSGNGEAVCLSRLWAERPLALVFLRHLGCAFCREHTAQLHRDAARFEAMGVAVALISVAGAEDTAAFCAERRLAPPFLCLSDPEKRAYRAYGLGRGTNSELFAPQVIRRGFQAALHGHFQGMPKGDPFQMPGVFIVDRSGIIRYAHKYRDASNNPSNEELLRVLASLAA